MRFEERFLEEMKSRIRPSDVIGRTVRLKRAGREWVGLSPFNQEKTPSFYVNDEKGFFHDFSSGRHGDLIAWLQDTQRLSFREAVETLALEAGVPLPAADPREAQQEKARAGLQDWLESAAKWFEQQLRRPNAAEARAYLNRRGLPEAEWPRFRLGFAPASRTALKDQLVAKGARPAELVEAGLLIAPEGGGAPYDRFRDRIIFPIADGRGRVISFGGRAMNPEDRAKYLNGPETPVFHKGRNLYGLQEARRLLSSPMRGEGEGEADSPLLVVEGYMDVIACQRAGVAAVAPMGTALTEEQMSLLWRSHPEPTLCFDGDAAGRRAAWRTLDRALPLLQPGRSFQFATLDEGKDPDDILREGGSAALSAALRVTRPFVEVLFEREKLSAEPLDTPERQVALKAQLRKMAAIISDRELSHAYEDELFIKYGELRREHYDVSTLRRAGQQLAYARWRKHKTVLQGASVEAKRSALRLKDAIRPFDAAVAHGLLLRPTLADERLETLATQRFRNEALNPVADEIVAARVGHDLTEPQQLLELLAAAGLLQLAKNIATAASQYRAPFLLDPHQPQALKLWSVAMDALIEIDALTRAMSEEWQQWAETRDSSTYYRLKAERDVLRRSTVSGDIFGVTLH